MALKTFVKLNRITNLTDARYGAGMYVDLLGFNLDPNAAEFINPERFKEIAGWVSGVEFVGEFNHGSRPDLLQILKEYPAITWVEYDRIEELQSLIGKGYGLIYKMNLEEVMHIEPEVAQKLNESGIIFHVSSEENVISENELGAVAKLSNYCKVILGTGINEENVLDLIQKAGPYGISVTGGEEFKPGLKDLDQLADILEKLEIED
jgi:phosphoribosylanthranilate isomerase